MYDQIITVCEGYVFTCVCLSTVGGMHGGGMHGQGVCVAGEVVCGRGQHGRGHAWWGACMAQGHLWQGCVCGRWGVWQGVCIAGGMHGREGACVAGRSTLQDTLNEWAVCILLECILVMILVSVRSHLVSFRQMSS